MVNDLLAQVRQLVLQGDLSQAKEICKRILEETPDDAGILFQLGAVFLLEKNFDESRRYLQKALARDPQNADALNNLGTICLEHDMDFDAAGECFLKALKISPRHFNALMNLGNTYGVLNRLEEACRYYDEALAEDPDNGILLNNLGALRVKQNRRDDAIEYYRRAAALLPDDPDILANLITSLKATRKKEEILKLLPQVKKMQKPGAYLFPLFCFAKGYCLWDEAYLALQAALKLVDEGRASFQNFEELNLPLLAAAEMSCERLSDIHKLAGKAIEKMRTASPFASHERAMASSRRWRVGYLSPDFKDHVVNYFFRGLINSHDRDCFEVYCYSNTWSKDDVTEQYRAAADVFVDVTDMSDEDLAKRIHADGIHFLVDLAGYTSDSRLRVMSYRPAPVQISYIGYPFTSGLSAVDYIVVDPYIASPKNAECFTEQQLCLPETYYTFESLKEQVIDPVIPFKRNSYITFGSLINLYKINPDIIRVWCDILRQVPGSRMILNHPNFELEISRNNVLKEFVRNGIEGERVTIIWQKHPEHCYLRYYNDIDIVLDSFPMTGGTTSIDTVWMGKPLITLVGEVFHQRISYSVLNNIGIGVSDLIAFSEEEYVQKAVALANNPARIDELHHLIPPSLKKSTLCNPIRFTRQIETAYIEGWQRKFGISPVRAPETEVEFISLKGGVEIALAGTLDDENTYILKEQQKWFESEFDFVMQAVKEGGRIIDIGAGVGCYSIPLAERVGDSGMVLATVNSASAAEYLKMSLQRNQKHNLNVLISSNSKLMLDQEMEIHDLHGIDFVRLHLDTREENTLHEAGSFFTDNSPLVMLGIRRDNKDIDTVFTTFFRKLGYEIYRLVPGLTLLVPFRSDDDLDVFSMNLFACKPDQAEQLADRALLVQESTTIEELPGIHIKWWQEYLRAFPYALSLLPQWVEAISCHEEWEAYWVALNLFAMAEDHSRQSEERYAALLASYNILLMLVQAKPTLPRVLSFCRVLNELGKREAAVNVLNEIAALFESGAELSIDEPFLAVSDEYAAIDPSGRTAEWLVASILWQREKLRAFSSYFTGQESLPVLEEIKASGFYTLEVDRRIALIRQRYNL